MNETLRSFKHNGNTLYYYQDFYEERINDYSLSRNSELSKIENFNLNTKVLDSIVLTETDTGFETSFTSSLFLEQEVNACKRGCNILNLSFKSFLIYLNSNNDSGS